MLCTVHGKMEEPPPLRCMSSTTAAQTSPFEAASLFRGMAQVRSCGESEWQFLMPLVLQKETPAPWQVSGCGSAHLNWRMLSTISHPPSPSSPMQKRQHTLKRLRQEAPKPSTVHKLSGTSSSSSTSPRPPVRGQAGAATATPPKADCRGHSSVGLESAGQPPSRCCVPARARKALGTSVVSSRAGRSDARKPRREARRRLHHRGNRSSACHLR
mmetsp:Transcript_85589/g.276213  ORF Transcript_85589/g.276213 Transcript_85589/m.276213 type:complete len:214 (+) Transcript_85589:31-672(+)